jgi:hypothetical protein
VVAVVVVCGAGVEPLAAGGVGLAEDEAVVVVAAVAVAVAVAAGALAAGARDAAVPDGPAAAGALAEGRLVVTGWAAVTGLP